MITLGVRCRMMPSTPAGVVRAFRDRGTITIVPEVFRSGHRGPSSYLLASDSSELQAFIPAFGDDAWATSPEGLAAELMRAGLVAVIAPGAPPPSIAAEAGPYDGRPILDHVAPATVHSPRSRAAPASAYAPQLELFA